MRPELTSASLNDLQRDNEETAELVLGRFHPGRVHAHISTDILEMEYLSNIFWSEEKKVK